MERLNVGLNMQKMYEMQGNVWKGLMFFENVGNVRICQEMQENVGKGLTLDKKCKEM